MLRVRGAGPRTRLGVVAGLFIVALISGAWLLDRGSRSGSFSTFEAAQLFDQVFEHASTDFVDSLPDSLLYRKAVTGMLYELHDPASAFLPADRFERLGRIINADSAPLGLALDIREKSIVVIAPAPGSAAERAGIQPGDELNRIDGRATDGWTVEEANDALRGRQGTSVTVQIARPGAADSIRITLTRDPRRQSKVRQSAIFGDVGYVEIGSLDDSTAAELAQSVNALLGRGAHSLIIDLRDDASGGLSSGVRVAALFLDAGKSIVTIKNRDPRNVRTIDDSSAQKWPALPLTILVDDKTAGGSEVIVGALQDHDRALIVGRQTYGKGSDQGMFRIAPAGGVKLTTARWYTPSGRAIGKPGSDPQDNETQVLLAKLKRFRSDSGRSVFGSGGIVPDVLAGDTVLTYQEAVLLDRLGGRIGMFYDEVARFAADQKSRGVITSPDFVVTPAMRDEILRRLAARGAKIDKFIFDQAEPFVSRLVGNAIARAVFGSDGELRRRAQSDRALAKALELTRGARTEQALLRRGEVDRESADSVRAR